ncbi:XdhC family protein [Ascidiimonas aurantiaca]|uniref:XdhC family protein n=1 Tax=Ascidiimonas aurantiaca TaxID=1685432 RepID=UPI0030EF83FB
MTHELKKILAHYKRASEAGHKTVLASVVSLQGSSYRRPGVRMLIAENGTLTGAVSGGCVEKEIVRRAAQVFSNGTPLLITYDGRYRLGCEGTLYILIETFEPDDECLSAFESAIKNRKPITLFSMYGSIDNGTYAGNTLFKYSEEKTFTFSSEAHVQSLQETGEMQVFKQKLKPCFQLVIIGAEHDAVQLCSMASLLGWEVIVIASASDPRTSINFPGVTTLINSDPQNLDTSIIDNDTAVVLMTHSFANDLAYFIAMKNRTPLYLGLLGPAKRREKLWNAYLDRYPETAPEFFNTMYGPAGLNIGAETPQEIAIAILAEILAVVRDQKPLSLKDKSGTIHSGTQW